MGPTLTNNFTMDFGLDFVVSAVQCVESFLVLVSVSVSVSDFVFVFVFYLSLSLSLLLPGRPTIRAVPHI